MKVCIAEDDPLYRHFLEATLSEWGYEVVAVGDGAAAWEVLQAADAPALALLDWMMPGLDGCELCRKLRARPGRYVYLLLLTARSDRADLVRGLESGADDYLVKPFDPFELQARLAVGRRLVNVHEELIAAREAMRFQATRDALTGLWNRRVVLETLERDMQRARREGKAVAVILADLDHFKQINDTHGHLAGDDVLRESARRMGEVTRPYDSLGRYGGEEFLIVLPGCGPDEAVRCAERVRERLVAEPVRAVGRAVPVTASLGVAVCLPAEETDVAALLRRADGALYRAKQKGRNRVEREERPTPG